MRPIVVISKKDDWPLQLPGVEVVLARDYLSQPEWTKERGLRVFNMCRSYRYQSAGYYVSLLAAARRHRPFPALMTTLDMKSKALVRSADDDLDRTIERSLAEIRSDRFVVSAYFGRNMAQRHDNLARRLFAIFPAPLLRAQFIRGERWHLSSLSPIALRDVPEPHLAFLQEAAREYFERARYRTRSRRSTRYDLAILYDPAEPLAPSNPKALGRFRAAAKELGFGVEMIERQDYGRLSEFDALFIRETTAVNHHTFRFAQRGEADGLVVIDDPQSILRCGNKVFQAEALALRGVPIPRTFVSDGTDLDEIEKQVGFPCVLKSPDGAFSQGVVKCEDADALRRSSHHILEESDLLLVQEFSPSEFDWRIGVFAGEPLFAARYHMAAGHWQIVKKTSSGGYLYGKAEPVALSEVPDRILKTALKAALAMGDGLYGVDLKQLGRRVVVIEVNDNPNIDAGCEDALLKGELYRRIMQGLLERVELRKRRNV